jgi:hypothetical protein
VNGFEVFHAPALDRVLDALEADLQHYVAEMARDALFVHAGVVGWRGGAVLLPGRSGSGKTTLVRELVRAGATYYSDEYAVLDEHGRVHPFPCRLGVRLADGRRQAVGLEELEGVVATEPAPVALVVLTSRSATGFWAPRLLSPGQGALKVLAHSVTARRAPAAALTILRRTLHGVMVVESERAESAVAAQAILNTCPPVHSQE